MDHVLKFTDEQLGIVGAALAELPFKIAQPVMAAIQAQIAEAPQPKLTAKADQETEARPTRQRPRRQDSPIGLAGQYRS